MPRPLYAWIPFLMTGSVAYADNCDAISAQIDAKIRAAGVANFTLSAVPADQAVAGKQVGTCGLGTKKIMYTAMPAATAPANPAVAAAAASTAPRKVKRPTVTSEIITECKDGSMSLGGECKN